MDAWEEFMAEFEFLTRDCGADPEEAWGAAERIVFGDEEV